MNNQPKYKLLKDLIVFGSTPFRFNAKDNHFLFYKSPYYFLNKEYNGFAFSKESVENNPDFFELVVKDTVEENDLVSFDKVVRWMNTWEPLRHTAIPIRFKEYFTPCKKPIKPLFTTYDGVGVFDGDEVCILNTNNSIRSHMVATLSTPFYGSKNQFKYFSTFEAAQEYIDSQKAPTLSNESAINGDKLYTQKEMNEAEEAAFNESRLTHPMVGFKHDNYQSYKQSKNKTSMKYFNQ